MDAKHLERVFAQQDEAAMVDVACGLVRIPSPTGEEGPIGDYVAARFSELGMRVARQEVEPGRNNILATLKGDRPGHTLMFLAHLDVNTHPEHDLANDANVPVGYRSQATVRDGWIFGNGISNMKCAFAGFYSAIQMLRSAGARLAGDILVAGVVGEIEKAPVDLWQGRPYRGGGLGARFMVHHGVQADFCINGEPTAMRLQTGNAGYLFVRINIKGSAQATYSKSLAVNPLPKAFRLYQALERWEIEYQRRHSHPLMKALASVGGIYGGYPYKPSITPAFCNLYLHVNLLPGQSILDVRRELDELLAELRREDPQFDASLEIFLASNGYLLDDEHPLVGAVAAAHRDVFGSEPARPNPERYSVSSDNSPLAEFGIPGITYGAGGITREGQHAGYDPGIGPTGVRIENLKAVARVYAVAAIRLLGGAVQGEAS